MASTVSTLAIHGWDRADEAAKRAEGDELSKRAEARE